MTILLSVVGSRAYGLASESSDVDLRGVFVTPTRAFWRFEKPATSVEGPEPERPVDVAESTARDLRADLAAAVPSSPLPELPDRRAAGGRPGGQRAARRAVGVRGDG